MRSLMICSHHYYSGGQIEKIVMGGVCSTFGGEEKCLKGFGEET